MLILCAVASSFSSFFLNFILEWFWTVYLKHSFIFLMSCQSAWAFCCKVVHSESSILDQALTCTYWGHRWALQTITIVLRWCSMHIFNLSSKVPSLKCCGQTIQFARAQQKAILPPNSEGATMQKLMATYIG